MDEIDLKWKFVEQSLSLLQEQIDRVNTAARAALLCPESPLWEPAHVIGSRLVQALSELVEDNFGHISWYVSECDYGRNPKEAGWGEDMRIIDTVDRLRWLVDIDCEGSGMSDQSQGEINMFYATSVKAKCPACGEWLDGWIGNPRGSKEEKCDYCGAVLRVHPDADVEFDY